MKRALPLLILTLLLLLVGLLWSGPSPVLAKEFKVDSEFDDPLAHDINPGDGICLDSGNQCTLRAAIEESNAYPEVDVITFDKPMMILIHTDNNALVMNDTTIIDASSVWNTVDNVPGVILNGRGASFVGLAIRDDSCAVYGLHITDFSGGIDITSATNTVGGSGAGQRNVLSGNGTGLAIRTSTASSNIVRNNYIGLTPKGDARDPNEVGLLIGSGAANNIIGGNEVAHGNLISGNTEEGVVITGAGADGNWLGNNVIGPGADMATDLGNGHQGVRIHGGAANTVIGGIAGSVNFIGYNDRAGIMAMDAGSGTQVSYNIIGANDGHGVEIQRTADCLIEGNLIYSNGMSGVAVFGVMSTANLIWPNSIYSNTDKGITVGVGANTGIVPPVIKYATTRMVTGTLGCLDCTIALYSDSEDEGQVYHGTTTSAADGTWAYLSPVLGPHVTAAISDPGGNTSEFSAPYDISAIRHTVFLPLVKR